MLNLEFLGSTFLRCFAHLEANWRTALLTSSTFAKLEEEVNNLMLGIIYSVDSTNY